MTTHQKKAGEGGSRGREEDRKVEGRREGEGRKDGKITENSTEKFTLLEADL